MEVSKMKLSDREKRIIRFMEDHAYITCIDASKLGIYELPAAIFRLKKKGFPIKTVIETGVNRHNEKVSYAKYSLEAF